MKYTRIGISDTQPTPVLISKMSEVGFNGFDLAVPRMYTIARYMFALNEL